MNKTPAKQQTIPFTRLERNNLLVISSFVPPIAHETTGIETPTIEASSASVLEGELATQREYCVSMSEELTSASPQNQ